MIWLVQIYIGQNQLKNFNHLDKECTANSQNKEKKTKHFFKNMTPVSVCCWTGNQKQNIKGPPPAHLWCSFTPVRLAVVYAGQGKWLSNGSQNIWQGRTLDILYNKINTLARPSPLHFSSGKRHSLLQVPGKSIVKGTYFQVNSVWSFL